MTQLAFWCSLALAAGSYGPPVPVLETRPAPPASEPAAPIAAQPQALVLDLREALRIGLARNRTLRMSRLDSVSARASVTQALSTVQPQVDFNASYSRFESARTGITSGEGSSATSSRSISVAVDQLLFDNLQSLFSIYRARQDARATEYREIATLLDTAQQIAAAFFEVLRNDALLRLQEQLVAQAERQLAQTEARQGLGLSARLDVTRSQVALSNARVEMLAAESRLRTSLAQLRNLLLLPEDEPVQVVDTVPVPALELELDQALAAAQAEQPSIAAAAAIRRSRRHSLDAAQWNRWAQIRVTANYERFIDSSRNVESEYVVSASVNIPLWDGQSGKASVTSARAAYQRADEDLRRVRESIALEVEQAHLNVRDATARLQAAEEASALAAASLQQTEESFRLGVASPLDVTDARTEYARAESNRIQARFDRDLAGINLRIAIGRMPLEPANEEAPDA